MLKTINIVNINTRRIEYTITTQDYIQYGGNIQLLTYVEGKSSDGLNEAFVESHDNLGHYYNVDTGVKYLLTLGE